MGYAIGALLGSVVLVVAPGAAQPFTAPKLMVGTAGPAFIVLWALATRRLHWRVPTRLALGLGAFAAAMGLAAVRGGAASFPQFAFLLSGPITLVLILALERPDVAHPPRGLVWAAVVVATIAIVQRAGLDPWRLAGWAPSAAYASPRMRAYATLGNPNFVASVLAVALPWALAVVPGAATRTVMAIVLLGGILATGSRVGIVAAGAALACLAWQRDARRSWRARRGASALAVLAVVVGLGLAVVVSERTVGESIAGRLVPVRVAWPHALERPIAGFGLGAVARDYAAWQAAFFADPAHAPLARFAGAFDHLHDEPLEWLLETGLVGLGAWLAVVALALRAGAGSTGPPRSGASALAMRAAALSAPAAVAVTCLADFPLHRPADYLAAWLALAVAARPTGAAAPSP